MQSKSQIVYQAISSFIWNKGPIRIWNALWEMSKASGIILLGNKYVHVAPLSLQYREAPYLGAVGGNMMQSDAPYETCLRPII